MHNPACDIVFKWTGIYFEGESEPDCQWNGEPLESKVRLYADEYHTWDVGYWEMKDSFTLKECINILIVLLWVCSGNSKISDLTLLGAGQVSSSETLLLLDNSDPTDQNKRSAVGSIFTAVPSGSYTAPGIRFEGKTATGLFSETQGQVGLAMGNARLNLQKVGTTLNIQARDDADTNLDFTISAQGTGKIRLGSILAINDLNFIVPNSIDETKVAKFSSANLTAGLTNIYSFPSNEGLTNTTDELVTLKATQTIENKTIVSPNFTGDVSVVNIASSGNTTIGDEASDSLTVNAASTFAASSTFSNSLIANQGAIYWRYC